MNIDEKYRKNPRKIKVRSGTQKKISNKDIANLENKYGIYLPQDFKLFLLENNGAEVELCNYYKKNDFEDVLFQLESFYEVKDILYGYSDEEYDYVNKVINPPKGYLTIAYCAGGHSYILINLEKGDNYGKVFYSYDLMDDSIELVADNFTEFFNNSYPFHEIEFYEVCKYGDIKRAIEIIESGYKMPYSSYYERTMFQLLIESEYNMFEAIKLLISLGENIEGCLAFSFKEKKYDLVKYFMSIGLDFNKDSNNKIMDIFLYHYYAYDECFIDLLLENNIFVSKGHIDK
ncbi:MAG: SMI1/KNR4 family protein, partial [Candidatus Sericytochromatia bacterium]